MIELVHFDHLAGALGFLLTHRMPAEFLDRLVLTLRHAGYTASDPPKVEVARPMTATPTVVVERGKADNVRITYGGDERLVELHGGGDEGILVVVKEICRAFGMP